MVLAAGAGRRLRPYTDTLPKALVPVDGDTTIMDISLRNLAAADLRDVVIIVGYQAQAVHERKAELERRHGAIHVPVVDLIEAEATNGTNPRAEVREALTGLGYAPDEVRAVIGQLPEDGGVEDLLRDALKRLATVR